MTVDDLVQTLTVGGRHVLHVADVLQAPLNLERRGTGLNEPLQVVALVHVLQRQQVAVVLYHAAVGINQVELHAAELGARATVGRTAETVLRGIAQPTVTDAEGAMNKDLQLHVGHLTMNLPDLIDRQFTGQHHTAEAQLAEPPHFLGRAVVGLGGCVEF